MTLSDYTSIIHSASFTFLVGPEHTKLTIQSGLARHVSKPLDALMNNGQTRESRHRIAVLENEDVETFVGFCEYAYTGDYTVPSHSQRRAMTAAERENSGGSERGLFRTESVFTSIVPPVTYSPPPPDDDYSIDLPTPVPEEGSVTTVKQAGDGETTPTEGNFFEGVQAEDAQTGGKLGKKGGKKGKKGKKQAEEEPTMEETAPMNLTPPITPPPGSEKDHSLGGAGPGMGPHSPEIAPEQADSLGPDVNPRMPSVPPRSVDLWDEFTTLHYDHRRPSNTEDMMSFPRSFFSPTPKAPSSRGSSEPQPEPYVLFHAKLYIFAANYLIPSLAQLCLQKLHQDLIDFGTRSTSPDDGPAAANDTKSANMRMILQLLHFSYSNTTRWDPFFHLVPHHEERGMPPPKEDQLRKLVAHYAACKVRDLAAITSSANYFHQPPMSVHSGMGGEGGFQPMAGVAGLGFRELLDGTRELASDLVYKMM